MTICHLLAIISEHPNQLTLLHAFLLSAGFFFKIKFLENFFRNTISVKQYGSRSGLTFCQV